MVIRNSVVERVNLSGVTVTSLNSLTGAVTLSAGSNITITPSGNDLQIASTGGGVSLSGTNTWTGQNTFNNFAPIVGTSTANTFTYFNGSKALSSVTLGAIGSSPNANAMSLSAGTFTLQPASASFGGVVTTGTQTFAGAKTFSSAPTFSSLSTECIPYINTSGVLATNSIRLKWNNTLAYAGFGTPTPAAVGHFNQTTNETATPPTSVTATAVLETLAAAPTSSNITSTVYQTDVPQALAFTGTTQNTGTGNYTCNGQTINYRVWSYIDITIGSGTNRYYTLEATTSFTDTINDGTTTFDVRLDYGVGSGLPSGYFVESDSGGTFGTYVYDVGPTSSVNDYGGSFSSGFGTSTPTGPFFLISSGSSRNYRARGYATPPVGTTYYFTSPYDYTVTEPSAGENYLVYHSVNDITGYNSLYQYGANDGSVTFTNQIVSGVTDYLEYKDYWNSGSVTESPTSYTSITGSGQTLKYKARTRVVSGGYNYYYSSSESNESSVVVPNTGLKYYITITGTAGTSTTPSGINNSFGYRVYKAAPTSYTESTTQGGTSSISALASYDTGTEFTAGTEATPTSYIGSAALFQSQGFGDPLATGTSYSLQAIYQSTSSSTPTCGFEMRDNTGARVGMSYATGGVYHMRFQNFLRFGTIAGSTYMEMSSSGIQYGSSTFTVPVIYYGNATVSNLLYLSPSTLKVTIGSSTGAGMFNVIGYSSIGSGPVAYIQHHGSGNALSIANSSASVLAGANSSQQLFTHIGSTSSATGRVPATLSVNTTAVGNVGTGEDTLMTYSIPASTLATNGDAVEFCMAGTFANNANNKRLKIKYGSTTLLDTTALVFTNGDWEVRGKIIRTGAATQKAIVRFSSNLAVLASTVDYTTPAETLSGSVSLFATGEATSNDDVKQELLTVEWKPNP